MTNFYTLLLSCAIIAGAGCKTTSKSYQKGDYEDAIERGVKKLQKDPYDYETRDLVQKSYNYSVSQYEDQIRILSNSKSDTRFERIYDAYANLQRFYDLVHQYPAVVALVKTTDYSDYVATYRDKSADTHIEKAQVWEGEGTKLAYRNAYNEYNVALRYRPEDFQLRRKRDSIYDAAITKVIVAPASYQFGNLYQMQNFQRDVLRTLSYNMGNQFVRFYSEAEARVQNVLPDQILELNLSRISLGQPFDTKNVREVSKEVVMKETVYRPDSVVKQLGTVKAKITTTKRTLLSQGDLFVTVRDMKGRVIWNDRFTGEHKWQTEFASYTGDERALTDADKTILNQTSYTPPGEDQIMDELLKRIQDDLTSRLQSYYTRFQ